MIATTDYRKLVENPAIEAVMISTTPEPTHYPIAKESLLAGKHVFLEKPIALELAEADELIALAASKKLAFTIGYSWIELVVAEARGEGEPCVCGPDGGGPRTGQPCVAGTVVRVGSGTIRPTCQGERGYSSHGRDGTRPRSGAHLF